MDPLSEILAVLNPESYLTAGVDAEGSGPSGSAIGEARSNATP